MTHRQFEPKYKYGTIRPNPARIDLDFPSQLGHVHGFRTRRDQMHSPAATWYQIYCKCGWNPHIWARHKITNTALWNEHLESLPQQLIDL